MAERSEEPSAGLVRALVRDFPDVSGTWQVLLASGNLSHRPARPGLAFAPDHRELAQALETALRPRGEKRWLLLRVVLDGAGGWVFSHTFVPSPGVPPIFVLDPAFRPVGNPAPGMPRPPAAAPDPRPTDPEVLERIRGLVAEAAACHRAMTGEDAVFGEPRTEADLVAAEQRMGLRLPDDVRALHLVIGSDPNAPGILGNYALHPLERTVEGYLWGEPGCWDYIQEYLFDDHVLPEPEPLGAVRTLTRDDWWVVIASDSGGHECAVDLDPGPLGHHGQLLSHGRGSDGVELIAESATALLTTTVETHRRGEEMSYPYNRSPEHWWFGKPGGDLATRVAALPHPELIQGLYLNDAPELDLTPLRALPNLRELHVVRCAGPVRLWVPEHVASLTVDAPEADLAVLAGHPALWDLSLRGLPVRVADLPALPELLFLDLSGADVVDVESLGELDVRALTLSAAQWARLRAADTLPPRLAAARIGGPQALQDVLDWTNWLTSRKDAAFPA
ncbi:MULTISPECIES: SMI1/KNR4 family protein [Actinosynnema]|uniref:SMI1/KNR4 family protein n=1 Tax=Actinosynnema TaxID=40566 RepID=UPI0020A47F3A|nr:SMI1/KNR4 family protein [Actinosynnema pretiosum]MCP2092426.1 Cell wall assembly regulator SMI1 [Actinosynnema pretiosum]